MGRVWGVWGFQSKSEGPFPAFRVGHVCRDGRTGTLPLCKGSGSAIRSSWLQGVLFALGLASPTTSLPPSDTLPSPPPSPPHTHTQLASDFLDVPAIFRRSPAPQDLVREGSSAHERPEVIAAVSASSAEIQCVPVPAFTLVRRGEGGGGGGARGPSPAHPCPDHHLHAPCNAR
jgi:hypothetical protein